MAKILLCYDESCCRITGLMPHGASYWADNGVTVPTRDDYTFHIEYNYIAQFGMGILNDMGAVYVTTNTVSCDMTTEEDYDKGPTINDVSKGGRGIKGREVA